MRIAIKFDERDFYPYHGYEPVLFRKQMLIDVYYHEHDPMPSLEAFLNGGEITRPNDETFWVYRQGAYLDETTVLHGLLYVAYAKTEDLDKSPEPTFEQYSFVPTLMFGGGAPFKLFDEYSLRTSRILMEKLYIDVRDYN